MDRSRKATTEVRRDNLGQYSKLGTCEMISTPQFYEFQAKEGGNTHMGTRAEGLTHLPEPVASAYLYHCGSAYIGP